MASLVEELILVLGQENEVYEKLIPVVQDKTKVIVSGDLEELQRITYKEQEVVDNIATLEKKRQRIVDDIADVINQDADSLTVKSIIELLEKQPKEQKQLAIVHDKIKKSIDQLVESNKHNKALIEQSLEMTEFSLSLLQNVRLAPTTGNYTNKAYSSDQVLPASGMFDTKQ